MICVVTGAAGFIGSTVSRKLLDGGVNVRGVDNFADFYPRKMKEVSIRDLRERRFDPERLIARVGRELGEGSAARLVALLQAPPVHRPVA